MQRLHLKGRDNFLRLYLMPAIHSDFVSPLYPDQPRHPHQKYLLTPKGLVLLASLPTPIPDGTLPGSFTVSADSIHNNHTPGTRDLCSNRYTSRPSYSGRIDLFDWGTGTCTDSVLRIRDGKFCLTFTDWGINPIINGGGTPSRWRTLTYDEWRYILYDRPDARRKYGFAIVCGIPPIWKNTGFPTTTPHISGDNSKPPMQSFFPPLAIVPTTHMSMPSGSVATTGRPPAIPT